MIGEGIGIRKALYARYVYVRSKMTNEGENRSSQCTQQSTPFWIPTMYTLDTSCFFASMGIRRVQCNSITE